MVFHEYLGRETAEKYLQYALDVYSSLFPHYGGRGGGWFVAPEKTVRQKIRTVCLEHGKKDPYGGQEYALVPIETVSENKTRMLSVADR